MIHDLFRIQILFSLCAACRYGPTVLPDAGVGSVTGNPNLHVLRFEKKSDVTTYIWGLCIFVIQIDLCNKVKVSCPAARREIFKLDTIFETFRSRMSIFLVYLTSGTQLNILK